MPNNNDGFDTPLDQAQVPGPAPAPAPARGPGRPPAQKMPAPVQAPAPQPIVNRYSPYILPMRIGMIDNETQQPVVEAQDMNEVILATLSDILNRLDRIESSL